MVLIINKFKNMQKVISITTSLKRDVKIYEIVEEEYKELNKFLDDGYKIVDKFTIIKHFKNFNYIC